jgi:hypothetical protein
MLIRQRACTGSIRASRLTSLSPRPSIVTYANSSPFCPCFLRLAYSSEITAVYRVYLQGESFYNTSSWICLKLTRFARRGSSRLVYETGNVLALIFPILAACRARLVSMHHDSLPCQRLTSQIPLREPTTPSMT